MVAQNQAIHDLLKYFANFDYIGIVDEAVKGLTH
jgi:hypothetical protein